MIALITLILAIVAAIFAFGGIAGAPLTGSGLETDAAKFLFFIFLALFLVSALVELCSTRRT